MSLSCHNRMSTIAIVLSVLTLSLTPVRAEELADLDAVDAASLTDLVVELKDEQGNPVAGAAVKAYAMRMNERSGHGFWNDKKLGPPKSMMSDESGRAVIQYPAKVYYSPEVATTRLVSFSIRHSDFVQKEVHFDLGPKTAVVELKKGCEIQLSAVDQNNQPVTDFGVLMAGPYAPELWADDGSGGRRTSAASDGNWQTLLVKPQADGVTLFSSILPLRVRPSQSVRIRNVKLKPGTRVLGKVAADVPRPVVGGHVMTVAVPKPANDAWAKESPSLIWYQWADIDAEGNFTLNSIPRSGEIQVIATCQGWISSTTLPGQNFFVMGQLFPIEGETMEIDVQMERTGSLELSLLKPDGQPLDQGTVTSWPNQKFHKGGSTVLGARFESILTIENQLLPVDQHKPMYSRRRDDLPFSACPVKEGKAVLKGIPVGRRQSMVLSHPDYILPSEEDPKRGSASFKLESAEPEQISLTVVAIEKP